MGQTGSDDVGQPEPAEQTHAVAAGTRGQAIGRDLLPGGVGVAHQRGPPRAVVSQPIGQPPDLVHAAGPGQPGVDLLQGHDVGIEPLDPVGDRLQVHGLMPDRGLAPRQGPHVDAVQQVA